MPGTVFVLQAATESEGKKKLVAMQPAPFAKEADFQSLLSDHPELLSGDQIDPISPRRWLLISREQPIASEKDGANRFYVDHLFVDQDAIPTLVEVKRQSDTRLRREVVAQMLDYAANGAAYWPPDVLRSTFEKRHGDHDERLRAELGVEDVDGFWQKVKDNLLSGKLRLLFVADEIPAELRRIVEFLNEQMDPAEVLALELRQYEAQGLTTLVPALYGQSEKAKQRKGVAGLARDWSEEQVFEAIEQHAGVPAREVAQRIADWMRTAGAEVSVGRGVKNASVRGGFAYDGHKINALKIWNGGWLEIGFATLLGTPFRDEHKRRELLARINTVQGVRLPEDAIGKYPSIPLKALLDPARLQSLLTALDWMAAELHGP